MQFYEEFYNGIDKNNPHELMNRIKNIDNDLYLKIKGTYCDPLLDINNIKNFDNFIKRNFKTVYLQSDNSDEYEAIPLYKMFNNPPQRKFTKIKIKIKNMYEKISRRLYLLFHGYDKFAKYDMEYSILTMYLPIIKYYRELDVIDNIDFDEVIWAFEYLIKNIEHDIDVMNDPLLEHYHKDLSRARDVFKQFMSRIDEVWY